MRDPVTNECQLNNLDTIHILVGTVGTLGVGVNLHRANRMIVTETLYRKGEMQQLIKRTHRIRQEDNVIVEILRFK